MIVLGLSAGTNAMSASTGAADLESSYNSTAASHTSNPENRTSIVNLLVSL